MTDKRVELVEAKITPEEAVKSAIEFARANGVAVFECSGCKHVKDADILRERGHSPGHGSYMVSFRKESFDQGNRHYQTGELLRDIAMHVLVNYQTGEAERFWSL
jgi:hypothetical protein